MAEDRRLTISSSSRLHPDEVARHTFATARRGFEPQEVRAYLEQLARDLTAFAEREQELRDALADAERRAANPVLDEATLAAALGQETARVLRSAHEAAAELVGRAEEDASLVRSQTHEASEQLMARAEQHATDRMEQGEAASSELRRRAQEDAGSRLEAAKLEAEALAAQTRAECRAMVQEAQELRSRVLSDLTRRRKVLHTQIEQLRAGRERLAETIGGARRAVDQITDELFRAEDEARLAAEEAGRQAATHEETDDLTLGPDLSGSLPEGPEPVGAEALDAVSSGAAPAVESERQQAVEELFARLRAERNAESPTPPAAPTLSGEAAAGTEDVRPYEAGTAQGAGEVPVAGERDDEGRAGEAWPGGTASGDVRLIDDGITRAAVTGADAEAGAGEDAGPDGGRALGATIVGDAARDAAESERSADGRHPLLARRDEVLSPIVANLARRMKRALQDDQNDLLDRLRAAGGWSADLLSPVAEHEQRYVNATVELLGDAARSGATFGGGKPDDAPGVDGQAFELAASIVAPLRRRLDAGRSMGDDEIGLIELVGAAFREWKGPRVERLAGDQAVATFSQAELAVAPPRSELCWIVDDGDNQCPDCDDNALAGPLPRGAQFPTGHPHPPAHAGCRCLLAPTDT